jgi:release factor glutamine methyltransferase
MTLGEWYRYMINRLCKIYPAGEAKSIARVVFEDVLQLNPINFFLEAKNEVDPSTHTRLEQIVKRLLQHEPVQYITGTAYFYGLKFKVTPNVLIPRPETEELVKWVLLDLKGNFYTKTPKIIDIGTGSGCIAIALKRNYANATVFALDKSEDALVVARGNALKNDVKISFIKDDILKKILHHEQYDVIVSNPPYIKISEQRNISPNVINYEPHTALFVDNDDALLFYKAISKFASDVLNSGGHLYFEINESLGMEVKQLLEASGFLDVIMRKDLNGKERMIRCTSPLILSQ